VLARGLWLHSKSILLGPRKYDSFNGYHLLTPLARRSLSGGKASTILVNRGFVSDTTVQSADKNPERISRIADGTERAEVDVIGLLSPPFTTSIFTPDNHPEKGEWIWPDLKALVEHAGGEEQNVQPVLVDSIFGEWHPHLYALVFLILR
jgi:surfeit locus 1 family protein